MMTTNQLKPWDFQPGIDTNDNFPAFSWYLRLPPPRKLSMLAGQFQVSVGTIRNWADRGLWSPRARAYDEDLAKHHKTELDALYSKDGAEVAKQQLGMIALKNAIVEDQLEKLARQCLDRDSTVLKPGDIIRLRREAFLEERLVRGQATAIVDGELHWENLNDQELALAEQLFAKLKGTGI